MVESEFNIITILIDVQIMWWQNIYIMMSYDAIPALNLTTIFLSPLGSYSEELPLNFQIWKTLVSKVIN